MANLQKILKLTQEQYDTLASGGTVGQYTGLNDNFVYFIVDNNTYITSNGGTINGGDLTLDGVKLTVTNNDLIITDGYGVKAVNGSNVAGALFADYYGGEVFCITDGQQNRAFFTNETNQIIYSEDNDYNDSFNINTTRFKIYDLVTCNYFQFVPGDNAIYIWNGDNDLTFEFPQSGGTFATESYVNSAIQALPSPMVFKGTLGTGGTITSLPTASSSNEGFTYKVITAGTYASQSADVGDVFISNGSAWTLVPSGDEPSGTVTNVATQSASGSHLTLTGGPITSSGTITVGVESGYSIPSNTKQSEWNAKYDKPSTGIPSTDLAESYYLASNPNGYISGITSSMVTTALGYTPYNSSNPNGYITSSALNGYATQTWVGQQGYLTSVSWDDVNEKPTFATVATSGSYNDLSNKPTIPASQVQTDWNATSGMGVLLNKPTLATVATSGSYNDLSNKPSIPTVNNETINIYNGEADLIDSFTLNQSTSKNITLPYIPSKATDVNDYGNKYVNPTQVRDYQTIFGIAPTLLTNINGHDLSSVYNTISTTIGGYPAIKIVNVSGSTNLTFDESHNYMRKITGSNFTPIFDDGTVPQYSYIVGGDGTIYKPQWDSTNGLVLYIVNKLALSSDILHVVDLRS